MKINKSKLRQIIREKILENSKNSLEDHLSSKTYKIFVDILESFFPDNINSSPEEMREVANYLLEAAEHIEGVQKLRK